MGASNSIRIFGIATLLLAPTALTAGGIPAKTLKDVKAASVYIKLDVTAPAAKGKSAGATGSGFLVHVAGNVGYIATNNHVVTPPLGQIVAGTPRVVFDSGTPAEQTVNAQVVARDAVNDLAILKITGVKTLPKPIPMDPELEVIETLPVFAIGFPFGAALGVAGKNPSVTITKGSVSSLRQNEHGQVALIQIDAEINPGNSGGPVLDEKGRLVGVSVSKFVNARTVGFAIPIKPLAEMLDGKVSVVAFDTQWVVKDHAEVNVEVGLIDPLGKLTDAEILYRPAGAIAELPRPDESGNVAPMKDARRVWLKLSRGRGQGRFTLAGQNSPEIPLAYQARYVTAAGRTVVSPVHVASIDFSQVVYGDRFTADDVPPNGKPQKSYTHPMKAGRHYVLEMRADPRELDPRLSVKDATGQRLGEDDGAGGAFDALLLFSPPKDGDYQVVASAPRGTGSFTLRIREDRGQTIGAKGVTVAGELKPEPSFDPALTTPHHAIKVLLEKGKSYVIKATSKQFEPYLRLDNMSRLFLKNEDIGGSGESTLFFSPFQDGIYRLVITAFDSKVGPFEVSVREAPGPTEQEIGADGLKVSGSLKITDPIDVVNRQDNGRRCQVFPLRLKAGQKYQIDMTSNQFDTYLRVENQQGRQLAFDDDSGGNLNARLVFTPPADDVYRLIATQFDQRVGSFELSVRALP